jgi:hypothetical protein
LVVLVVAVVLVGQHLLLQELVELDTLGLILVIYTQVVVVLVLLLEHPVAEVLEHRIPLQLLIHQVHLHLDRLILAVAAEQ